MLIIEIDHLHTKPAQTCIARFAYVIGLAADAAVIRPRRIAHDSKFCSNNNPLTMRSQRPSNQLFISVRPVHVGGVEKRDAEFQRPMDRGDGFLIVAPAIKI